MTPITPFRPPASRSNAGPQFASTPRFLFSQPQSSSAQGNDDDKDLVDDISNDSPSTVRYADRDARRGGVIEDVQVEEDERDTVNSPNILDDDLCDTPTGSAEVDSEFEDLFGPPERTKRRRISPEPKEMPSRYGNIQDNVILTSSLDPDLEPSWNEEPPVTPFPRRPRPLAQQPQQDEAVTGTQKPSTPATGKSAFRHHPRFLFSASQQSPSGSQARTPFASAAAPVFASQPPTFTPRRKPAFVLPRSPSPSRADDDSASLPTPFSPSSRTLHQRGRQRHDIPGYVPGGMAAEVRSWVLEMGTKREQLDSPAMWTDSKKYLATARIGRVVGRSILRSSGALAFVEVQLLSEGLVSADDGRRNILLMGSPRSRAVNSELGPDRVIGVYRGLVWEIELDRDGVDDLAEKEDPDVTDLSGFRPSNANDRERWLVVMEWDLL